MSYLPVDKMQDHELVSIIVGKRIPKETIDIITRTVVYESAEDHSCLVKEPGIGASIIEKLDAALELGRRSLLHQSTKEIVLANTPNRVYKLMYPILGKKKKESFYCLMLNTKHELIKMCQVSVGSLDASLVHPRELFKDAIRVSAKSIILVHNHPSGDPDPSRADRELTRRLLKSSELLGIELLDHIIIGEDNYVSLREIGVI